MTTPYDGDWETRPTIVATYSTTPSNPVLEKIYGDFTSFYVTITICTVLGFLLFLLNIVLCCCSRHKYYWQDSNTGNRWILPIWTKTPHQQPPLDYTELEKCAVPEQHVFDTAEGPVEYMELTHKKESDL
ncbi:uncharacterized protein wrm1 [Periplaneta americana]|uniref:uncharacterized protein wrm1 n=1 Tax=Periplaneta americana TaxID=6978 RepID=UPI0037E90AAB